MAVKVYESNGRGNQALAMDYQKEQSMLKKFKEALVFCPAIAVNFTTFVHGDELNIVSELAEMDLEVLLSGDYPEFETHAAHSTVFSPMNLLSEAYKLFEALCFLHEGIPLGIGVKQSIVHMDLKPDNILVFGPLGPIKTPGGHPVGAWKLADFNLAESSDIREAPPASVTTSLQPTTLGGFIRERSNRAGRQGAFLPPELRSCTNHLKADTKTDVWSIGCIMAVILAFAVNGPEGILELNTRRTTSENDYFYAADDHNTAFLKPGFDSWLQENIGNHQDQGWIGLWQQLVRSMLTIDKDQRIDMRQARERLVEVWREMRMQPFSKRCRWMRAQITLEVPSIAPTPPGLSSPQLSLPEISSPASDISLPNASSDVWSFLRLNFPSGNSASHAMLCPSGARACLWNKGTLALYEVSQGHNQLMWTDKQRLSNTQSIQHVDVRQCRQASVLAKARVAETYVALHSVDRSSEGDIEKVSRPDTFVCLETD